MASAEQLQNISVSNAIELTAKAETAMDAANNLIQAIDEGTQDYAIPIGAPYLAPDKIVKPTLHAIALDLPPAPEAPDAFEAVGILDLPPAPEFNITAPELTLPSAPTPLQAFTKTAPNIDLSGITFPDVPGALSSTPEAPTLTDITLPSKPNITLQTFDSPMPTSNLSNVQDYAQAFKDNYSSAALAMTTRINSEFDARLGQLDPRFADQLAAAQAQMDAFAAGGTGFKPAVENALYERNKDKLLGEANRTSRQLFDAAAKRGLTLPDGALIAGLRASRQAASDNLARAGVETVIKQAEIEQANLQFFVTGTFGFKQAMAGVATSIVGQLVSLNGQALEYAKDVADYLKDALDYQIKIFAMKLDAWKAEAAVYETKLRYSQTAIDIYKAEIEATNSLVNIDRAKVELYNSRIQALSTLASIYKTQCETVIEKANLQKLYLDIFSSEVGAYNAMAQAKSSEFSGYSSAIAGQEAKLRVYQSQISAFQGELAKYDSQIKSQTTLLDAKLRTNESLTQRFATLTSAWSSQVQAQAEVAKADLNTQQLSVSAFQAEASAAVANAQARQAWVVGSNQIAIEQARIQNDYALNKAKLKLQKTSAIASNAVQLSSTYEHAAASSLAGLVTIAGQFKTE